MILTNDNYYSPEANWEYMSVSQYKQFRKCPAAAMAQLRGEWEPPKTTALLVGSYVDSWFEGTLDKFRAENPEIFKRDGSLKADYVQAEEIIKRVQRDPVFMEYMSGQKQVIMTRELFGVPWKIKMDSYHPGKMIVDLKVMRSMERIMGRSFVEEFEYDKQLTIYSEVEGNNLDTYLAVVTKQIPSDIDIIFVPEWRRIELLDSIGKEMIRIVKVKKGEIEPDSCGVCAYCRSVKKVVKPLDFDLVGLSNYERRAIYGG